MSQPRQPDPSSQTRASACPRIDHELLARAAEINEAVAGEFAERAVSPLENPLIARMAELGVETDAAELSADARELSDDERAQVAALAVSWWDGVLTALRARELERRGNEP